MKNKAMSAFGPRGRTACCTALGMAGVLTISAFGPSARAGVTDLSNQPLATTPTVQAKPNLLFILDNSGSMDSAYMPDDMSGSSTYGYKAAQCNGVAYDPTLTYAPPLNADGTSMPNATFGAALDDGYATSGSATNLDSSVYYIYSGSQRKMGWVYTSSGPVNNTFLQECKTSAGSTSSVFTPVTVTSASSEAQNYANWYSYYRKRYLLMRTAMGRAISALDSSYRVGFSTISDKSAVDGTNKFRDTKDFDSTQKTNFYNSLYTAAPSGNTPLRGALSKAGRYFAKKVSGQTYDPMQYSCQRNYALLSTDGYWNTGLESTNAPRFGPYQLDNATLVGNQDGGELRPMKDDTKEVTSTVTPYSADASRVQTSVLQSRTITWKKVTVSSTGPGTAANGTSTGNCKKTGYYLVTTRTQTATETQTQQFKTPQTGTSTYTVTEVRTDGVLTSSTQNPTSLPNVSNWINGNTTVVITDTSTSSNPSTTTPIEPPSYGTGSTSLDCTQNPPSSGVTTTNDSATKSFAPTNITYSNSAVTTQPYTAGTPTVTTTTPASESPNTLADVAEYYYKTDLRDQTLSNCTSTSSGSSQDVCANIVRPAGSDTLTSQHMNTFTIGLGVSGTLAYDRNYLTQTTGDFADLKTGAQKWPTPAETSSGGNATNVDDLWHAAVNGRGQYYSALNAGLLAEAINGVITSVQQVSGSASAASTSSLELVAGNNQVYRASYTTQSWTGDLQAYALTGSDATIATTPTWSAQEKLDTTLPSNRKIYFNGTSGLQSLSYGNLSSTQQGYFNNLCSKAVVPAQCANLTPSDKALANNGTNLIDYLKGVRSYESTVATASTGVSVTSAALYRKRDHLLGDIINGAPVHVGAPPFKYGDAGYADFVTQQASRKNVVYVAANDGMLHAFSADPSDGGTELWAFVPTAVLPNLYKLADSNYGIKHQYFVDGAPVMADIQVGGVWKTILVGGLNAGGQGFYALDITDPSSPKVLWEFSDANDANMGLSFGNPLITKLANGTWVVAVSSGYNNTSGDGQGHLYILNANSGAKLLDISTGVGSSTDPSGLAKINVWVDNSTDNTGKRFYGGDLKGNVWRFDVDNLVLPHQAAMQLAKLQTSAAAPQPVTTKPELALVSGKPVVIVGTGRYLGSSDITDTQQQSIYAFKDNLTATGWGDVRADTTDFVQQTFTVDAAAKTASVSNLAVDWATKAGWWIDLPHTGERMSISPGLQFSTLAIATAIPNGDACASGGSSWRYFLNVTTGGVITTNPTGELWSSNSLIVGLSWVKDTNGNVRVISQGSNGDLRTEIPPIIKTSGSGSAHRTSWRELTD